MTVLLIFFTVVFSDFAFNSTLFNLSRALEREESWRIESRSQENQKISLTLLQNLEHSVLHCSETRGVRYAKSLSMNYFMDINILQNSCVSLSISGLCTWHTIGHWTVTNYGTLDNLGSWNIFSQYIDIYWNSVNTVRIIQSWQSWWWPSKVQLSGRGWRSPAQEKKSTCFTFQPQPSLKIKEHSRWPVKGETFRGKINLLDSTELNCLTLNPDHHYHKAHSKKGWVATLTASGWSGSVGRAGRRL